MYHVAYYGTDFYLTDDEFKDAYAAWKKGQIYNCERLQAGLSPNPSNYQKQGLDISERRIL